MPLSGAGKRDLAMRPNLPTITATLATRQWVRERRAFMGRDPTPDELEFFVRGRYHYLNEWEQSYVYECARALPARRINE